MKVATYNIHRCIGTDGRNDPARIAAVLHEIKADIIGLQEVYIHSLYEPPHPLQQAVPPALDRRHPIPPHPMKPNPLDEGTPESDVVLVRPNSALAQESHMLNYLMESTGHSAVDGVIIERHPGRFGNALLTSYRILAVRHIDLTIRGAFERRGALDVDLDVQGKPLRVFVAHLGLGLWERYFQVQRLVRNLGEDRSGRVLMMGDFNLFSSLFPRLRRLHRRLGHVPLVRTFPSAFPFLPLDRIWLQPIHALQRLEVHRTALSRVASDHLPLMGYVAFS